MSSRAEQLKQLWETMADLRGIVQEIERFQIECSFKQVRNTSINAVMIQVSDELWGIFGRLEAVRDALDEEVGK